MVGGIETQDNTCAGKPKDMTLCVVFLAGGTESALL
jgi:hypothetical protein